MPERRGEIRPFIIAADRSCNNHCRFCSQADLPREGAVPADLAARLRKARTEGYDVVELIGGEPTLIDGLTDWVAAARNAGFEQVGLQTNGRRLAYASYTRALAGAGLSHVEISVQGHVGELHEYLTGTAESFRQTVAGVKHAREAGLQVAIATVVTRSNMRHLPAIADLLVRLGCRHWRLRYLAALGRGAREPRRLLPRWSMAAPYLRKAITEAQDRGVEIIVAGLPLCVMPATAHVFETGAGGAFAKACSECAVRSRCAGAHPQYLALYGDDELRAFAQTDESEPAAYPASMRHAPPPFVGELGLDPD